MKPSTVGILCLTIGIILTAGCGATTSAVRTMPAPSLTPSATPSPAYSFDPCNEANIANSVRPLNDVMDEFDSYAELASNVLQTELGKIIPLMQSLRRSAEDLVVPACLKDLQRYAISYMDATLQTLISFQSTPAPQAIATGIAQARQYYDQYSLEMARLLGGSLAPLTLIPPPPVFATAIP